MTKQIDVVGAVLVRDGTVLAAQRGPTMALAGHWEFPGGKIEAGESPQEALARELDEELLCTATIGDHVETTSYEYDFGIVTLTTYFATLDAGEPRATEHAELRWIPVRELQSVEWAPADIPAVERIMQVLAE
ncbi:MAG TPA: (deoxy)nucleoside triphosphate pyrophosphohydrolase [Flexivirga sp.]|uniref:(deoxy)nucleoside triphosphate pyrophosphohydrolase n=1 Tax=Flexivirga sp. TaxID=1962927 RepID=UPI002B7261C5|nr:(deoxy)nucleoside triphosphate pyrophosphohydrolase [Flexivirga sp.]HWC24312.1 (deoxy)nucleoside triphosphate pyrophosphohydrolase [Flexivirga sp.]